MKKFTLPLVALALVVIVVLSAAAIVNLKPDQSGSNQSKPETTEQINERILSSVPENKLPTYTHADPAFSFEYPPVGFTEEKTSNGVQLRTSDFKAANGLQGVSSGTVVTVHLSPTASKGDTEAQLTTLARQQGSIANPKFIEVAGQKAIRFEHKSGENRNNHVVVLFVKDGQQYIIDQQYALTGTNPLPPLVDTIVSTFKFNQ